jgi:hypothetical protein
LSGVTGEVPGDAAAVISGTGSGEAPPTGGVVVACAALVAFKIGGELPAVVVPGLVVVAPDVAVAAVAMMEAALETTSF